MAPVRAASLAIVLVLASAGGVTAQVVGGPNQGRGASSGVMPPPFLKQAPCMAEFGPLRTEAEKRAVTLKAAASKRAPPQEVCQLFVRFVEAEAKVVKFMEKNAASCGIPAQIVFASTANHRKAIETQEKLCAAEPRLREPRL